MKLFSDGDRPDRGYKTQTESEYGYLNHSGRDEAARVRAFMGHWFDQYPSEHRGELRSRLQCGIDREFHSASFELVLFAWARTMGYAVDVHPALTNGSAKRPDFLLTRGDECGFYLEAVVTSELSEKEQAAQRRVDTLLDAIDVMPSPNFFLGVIVNGTPKKAPSAKALKHQLSKWLASLDPDAVSREADISVEALPKWAWHHDGLTLNFRAIPKKTEARDTVQRTIGMRSGALWTNSRISLRDQVRDKGMKFGKLDRPLLVAVNVDSISLDDIDEAQALFGQEEYVETIGAPSSGRWQRKPDGLWIGRRGRPVLTRLSGVWIFHELDVWNLASRESTLYFHPYARHRLPEMLKVLPHVEVDLAKDALRRTAGQSLADGLKLPCDWPEASTS